MNFLKNNRLKFNCVEMMIYRVTVNQWQINNCAGEDFSMVNVLFIG